MTIRKKYTLFFVLISFSILLSQLLLQYNIRVQENDSALINQSGKQRMYSQQITKLALLISDKTQNNLDATKDKNVLSKIKKSWNSNHNKLISKTRSNSKKTESKINKLFIEIESFYDNINQSSNIILAENSYKKINKATQVILNNELYFLQLMDQIVKEHEINSINNLATLKTMAFLLGFFILIIIILGVKYIFNPLIKSLIKRNREFNSHIIMLKEKNLELIQQKEKIKQQADEIKEKNNKLDLSKKVAEESAIAKAQFLSNMSHEIRTPMHGILGIIEILLTENPNKSQLELLTTLSGSTKNLLKIINDILDYNKIDSGKLILEDIPFNLKNTVTQTTNLLQAIADKKGLSLNLDMDNQIPKLLRGDGHRLNQVITNLIGNALKFTSKGSVTIGTKILQHNEDDIMIYFSVTDTGIGIPENKLSEIFKNFSQADTQITRNYGGTGLGLAITKEIIELMGGEINVTSEVGKGSKFSFTLNFKIEKITTTKTEKSFKINEKSLYREGLKKILLVDDNALNLTVGKKYLKYWNLECDIAKNGKEAIKLVRENNYSLVLMDLQMPIMDGISATEIIRKMPGKRYQYGELPIIALTASAVAEIKQKVFDVGMDDFLMKPYKPEGLFKLLEKHLNQELT